MSSKKLLLVTTALEKTCGEDDPILFLGEWCHLYGREDRHPSHNQQIVPYHWDDRSKLQEDLNYIDSLHESLLEHLTTTLNLYHQIDRPKSYWRIIFGPWLMYYLIVLFDRWECLRVAFESFGDMRVYAIEELDLQNPPLDYECFTVQAQNSDSWNHTIFLRIIKSFYTDKCDIHEKNIKNLEQDVCIRKSVTGRYVFLSTFKNRVIRHFLATLDSLLGLMCSKYDIMFFKAYFSPKALIKINLALRQIPRVFEQEFKWPILDGGYPLNQVGKSNRASLKLSRRAESNFEAFVSDQIIRDIPHAYVEGFSYLLQKTKKINIQTKVICAATALWDNEIFKVWAAEKVLKGVKLVVVEHGGGFPAPNERLLFEEKICDKKVTGAAPYHVKHVRIPPSKLASVSFKGAKNYCSVIANDMSRYCVNAAVNGPISGQVLQSFSMVCDLYSVLDKEVQLSFKVKAPPNRGWRIEQRYIDKLGSSKVYTETSYHKVIARSRIIICTYPQTTLSEAMASGVPTILLYPAHLWGVIAELNPLLELMKSNKMIFTDYSAAAKHLNAIWLNPEIWWESADVIKAREEFFRCCLDRNPHWVMVWVKFLKEMNK